MTIYCVLISEGFVNINKINTLCAEIISQVTNVIQNVPTFKSSFSPSITLLGYFVLHIFISIRYKFFDKN